MKEQYIVLLDVGSYSLKALLIKVSQGQKTIVGSVNIPSKGVSLGVIYDIEACAETIKEAFQQLEVQPEDYIVLQLSNAYVQQIETIQKKYISPEQGKVLATDLSELREKASGVYLQENTEMVEVFLKHYKLDDRVLHTPLGMEGSKLESVYHVFACPKRILDDLSASVEKAGGTVGHFSFLPYYMPDSFSNSMESALLLDLGADTTRASFFKEGVFQFSFALPFGGNNITLDIKNSYPVSLGQAEELKKRFGIAMVEEAEKNAIVTFNAEKGGRKTLNVRDLSVVVQSRLDEILNGVFYHLSKKEITELDTVILVGGGQLSAIEQNIQNKIKVQSVQKAEINREKNIFKDLSPKINEESLLLYGMLRSLKEEVTEKENSEDGATKKVFGFLGKALKTMFKKSNDSTME